MIRLERNIVYSLPLISIVFEIIQSFIGSESKIMAVRDHGFFLIILFLVIKYFKPAFRFNSYLIILMAYFLTLLLLDDLKLFQYNYFVRSFDAKMLLPLAFIFSLSYENIQMLNKRMLWTHYLFVVSIVIFSIFGIGEDQYGGGSGFKTGTFTFDKIYIGSFLLIVSPLIYNELKGKLLRKSYLIIGILTFIILVLSVRRTAVVIVLIGALVYIYYYKDHISKIVLYLTIFITVLLVSFPLYQEILIKQLSARSKEFLSDRSMIEVLQGEMRYYETIAVWRERLFNPETKLMLFGESLFDSKGKYARGVLRDRPIHLDINTVLHGSGIIGLLLFIGFYVQLYRQFIRYKPRVNYSENKLLVYAFNGMYISNLFLLFSGGMTVITFNLITSLYMGGILGYFRYLANSQYIRNDSSIYSNLSASTSIEENVKKAFLYFPQKAQLSRSK
jgi:hypothetical protein